MIFKQRFILCQREGKRRLQPQDDKSLGKGSVLLQPRKVSTSWYGGEKKKMGVADICKKVAPDVKDFKENRSHRVDQLV